jgi:hypothetical protein
MRYRMANPAALSSVLGGKGLPPLKNKPLPPARQMDGFGM